MPIFRRLTRQQPLQDKTRFMANFRRRLSVRIAQESLRQRTGLGPNK